MWNNALVTSRARKAASWWGWKWSWRGLRREWEVRRCSQSLQTCGWRGATMWSRRQAWGVLKKGALTGVYMLTGKHHWKGDHNSPVLELASILRVTLSLTAHPSSLFTYFLWSSHAATLQGLKHGILLLFTPSLVDLIRWILSTLQGFKSLLHIEIFVSRLILLEMGHSHEMVHGQHSLGPTQPSLYLSLSYLCPEQEAFPSKCFNPFIFLQPNPEYYQPH